MKAKKLLPYVVGAGVPVLMAGASYKAIDNHLKNDGPFAHRNAYEFVQGMPYELKTVLLGLSLMTGVAAGAVTKAAIERDAIYKKLCGMKK